ncbi:Ail/Lom family outer membrane beta-barrel protein [Escherichia coli]|uniref:Ail/Lom family outer membrane beta-barrel protein n=1 Tax=Escherichia coli TaxID=562 RepID=UPI0022279D83|nr:Ail/Lom family outer membrane beta-barrel protein [Escherichia coli]MCW3336176.1 Ail/Lom family outer membrane beta-barrel protein [Escherichia coli]
MLTEVMTVATATRPGVGSWACRLTRTESVAIDIAYEGSGSGDWRTDGFIVGVGYVLISQVTQCYDSPPVQAGFFVGEYGSKDTQV